MKPVILFLILLSSYLFATDITRDQLLKDYFHAAARTNDLVLMQEFLDAGMPVNIPNNKGYSALMLASYHGHKAMVELLLKEGADACMQDKRGNTALMGAVFKGELRIARRLLAEGCNPDHQNNAGQTTAMFATLFGRKVLLEELKRKGANLSLKDKAGNDIYNIAESQGITVNMRHTNAR